MSRGRRVRRCTCTARPTCPFASSRADGPPLPIETPGAVERPRTVERRSDRGSDKPSVMRGAEPSLRGVTFPHPKKLRLESLEETATLLCDAQAREREELAQIAHLAAVRKWQQRQVRPAAAVK